MAKDDCAACTAWTYGNGLQCEIHGEEALQRAARDYIYVAKHCGAQTITRPVQGGETYVVGYESITHDQWVVALNINGEGVWLTPGQARAFCVAILETANVIENIPRCTSDCPTNHQGDTCPIHEGA
jgi:hypothetical protein